MKTTRTLLASMLFLPVLAIAQAPAPKPATPAPKAVAPAPTPVPKPTPVAVTPTGPIGEVALVTGSVTVAGRSLGTGDSISEGQTIVVGPNSYASLRFNDGGRVLLRPNTEFAVESFRFAGAAAAPAAAGAAQAPPAAAPAGSSAFFRLVRGGFRAVTGLIGKGDPQSYKVTTPAATIGIRGTDYEVQTCTDDCPTQQRALSGGVEVAGGSLEGLELAQAGGVQKTGSGILLMTNEGSVVLRTSRGDTVVNVGQVALALANGETFMLPKVPDALLLNSTPAPEDCQ